MDIGALNAFTDDQLLAFNRVQSANSRCGICHGEKCQPALITTGAEGVNALVMSYDSTVRVYLFFVKSN